jgi:hypothetical protein
MTAISLFFQGVRQPNAPTMEQDINKHFIAPAKCGDLVQVDPERWYGKPDSDGGLAFVAKVNANGTLDVSYSLTRTLSKEVLPTRIHPASFGTSAHQRSPDEPTRPSLLSLHHRSSRENFSQQQPACQEEPDSWKMWEIDFRCVKGKSFLEQ